MKRTTVPLHRVFIFQPSHPTRKIIEIDAQILTLEKRTWAETPSGKRHLLGTSAFYTMAAAERAKRGALVKMTQDGYLRLLRPDVVHFAEHQLQVYDTLGTFNPKGKPN